MKSRRAKLEEQKCLPSAEGFFVRCAGPRAARPLEPQAGGAPCTARLISAFRRPAGGLRRGAGVPGKSAPDTLPAGLGRSGRVKGPCPRPLGLRAAPTLDPPSTRKRATGPHRGLRGTVGVDGGQGSRSDRAAAWPLTPRNDPNAPGWWLGVLFPQPPATWRTPRRPPEALLICSCFALFRETTKRAFCSKDSLCSGF